MDIIDRIDEMIAEAEKETTWTAVQALRCLRKELKGKQIIEIVRCKDCRFRDPEAKMCECEHGIRWQTRMEDDWFCCGGKKKEKVWIKVKL